MLKKFSRMKLLDKILVLSGIGMLLGLLIYTFATKRPDRHYIVPKGYHGWVTVRYEKPDAPALEEKNGALEFIFSDSGTLETSSRFLKGWGRDEFFWLENGEKVPMEEDSIPEGDRYGLVHNRLAEYRNVDEIIVKVRPHSDTTLFDGTKIIREDTSVTLNAGRKVLQHFYLSEGYKAIPYRTPDLPAHRKKW